MGQFSWLDCKNGSQILDNRMVDVFLLIPKAFGGGHHHETCYDGYGHFGLCDVYEEVALWNRQFLSGSKILDDFRAGVSEPEMIDRYGSDYLRNIGITIACYDEDNAALRYPIKITHDPSAVYEDCPHSLSDPNQGWPADD